MRIMYILWICWVVPFIKDKDYWIGPWSCLCTKMFIFTFIGMRIFEIFWRFKKIVGEKRFSFGVHYFLCNINGFCIFWVLLSEHFYFAWIGFFKGLSLGIGKFGVKYDKEVLVCVFELRSKEGSMGMLC
jgi:hypothetical protein